MKRTFLIAASACLFLTAAGLQAGLTSTVTGTVYLQTDSGFDNVTIPPAGVLEGTFTSATINFDVETSTATLANYITSGLGTPSATLTSSGTLSDQMSSPTGTPGSPNGAGPGYSFEIVYTGTAILNPGDTVTVRHDDGVVLLVGGTTLINSAAPTAVKTDSYTNTTGSVINTNFTLYYEATHGNPSITQVAFASAVPEPTSILLLGTALLGLGTLVRNRFQKT